jgi:hypothetical protein
MTAEQLPTVPTPRAPFAAMLRTAFLPSAACGLAAVVVLWVLRDASGGLSALGGAAVAVAFFAAGLVTMKRLVNDNPLTLVSAALAVFLGQVIFLGLVILLLGPASWLDGVAFGVAVLVVALAWQICQVVAFVRMRRPVYDLPRQTGSGAADATGAGQ